MVNMSFKPQLHIAALSSRSLLVIKVCLMKAELKDGLSCPLYKVRSWSCAPERLQHSYSKDKPTERPALLLLSSLPHNKADLPLVTSKSAEMITRALRSITVSTSHQKLSEKQPDDTNQIKAATTVNLMWKEVKCQTPLPSLPPPSPCCESLHPACCCCCSCLCKSANFLPSKRAEWRTAERGGESSTIRSEEEGRGRRKRWREDLRACVYSFSLRSDSQVCAESDGSNTNCFQVASLSVASSFSSEILH